MVIFLCNLCIFVSIFCGCLINMVSAVDPSNSVKRFRCIYFVWTCGWVLKAENFYLHFTDICSVWDLRWLGTQRRQSLFQNASRADCLSLHVGYPQRKEFCPIKTGSNSLILICLIFIWKKRGDLFLSIWIVWWSI